MEKLLLMSFFKGLVLQTRKNRGLFRTGLRTQELEWSDRVCLLGSRGTCEIATPHWHPGVVYRRGVEKYTHRPTQTRCREYPQEEAIHHHGNVMPIIRVLKQETGNECKLTNIFLYLI